MEYVIDLHTHTIVSGHAYTTLLENAQEAYKNGIKVLGVTDHGPNMPGGPHMFYFSNITAVPREIYGVTILRGCEANIISIEGKLDIPKSIQQKLDIMIASLHDVCLTPGSRDENTQALINVMDNPYVDILGHLGNPGFPIHMEEVIARAKEKNILIEINNSSLLGSRIGSETNCLQIAKLCKQYGVNITVGSDSHICYQIGGFGKAKNILERAEVPDELIMNTDAMKIIDYLKNKGKLKDLIM
ncbi:MAG: phosphatase [Bacillota bacterium]|nr:phosphatase [Bacillota bacterium]